MRTTRRLLAAVLSVFALSFVSPAIVDSAQAVAVTRVTAVYETVVPAALADQGLTTVSGGHVLTRGHGSIPSELRRLGWVHIGDPDSQSGFVVDAYQGSANARSKAFTVTYADGRRVLLVHPLAPRESYHNSFAAVSPDGAWLVAGEWGTINRLLVFALPQSIAGAVQTLPLAATIALAHPAHDVQGCDFSSATQLLCSTNDTTTSLYPVTRQLLSLNLSHALDGSPVTAAVRLVGSVPTQDICSGVSGEVEGIDITDGVVRVAVNAPCSSVTEVFTYPRDAPWHAAPDIDKRTVWTGAPVLIAAVVERRTVERLRDGV